MSVYTGIAASRKFESTSNSSTRKTEPTTTKVTVVKKTFEEIPKKREETMTKVTTTTVTKVQSNMAGDQNQQNGPYKVVGINTTTREDADEPLYAVPLQRSYGQETLGERSSVKFAPELITVSSVQSKTTASQPVVESSTTKPEDAVLLKEDDIPPGLQELREMYIKEANMTEEERKRFLDG